MTTLVPRGSTPSILLQAGDSVLVSGFATVTRYRLDLRMQETTLIDSTAITTSQSFGPYTRAIELRVQARGTNVSYTVTDSFGPGTVSDRVANLGQRFASKGTAALTVADTGQTWSLADNDVAGSGLSIISGKLTNTAASADASAGYAQYTLANNVKRIGADFTFSAGGAIAGSAVLVVWQTPIVDGIPAVPDSPLHLAITPTGYDYGTWTAGSLTSRGNGTFATALTQDSATVYHAEVVLIGTSAILLLPDGSVRTITHAAIGTEAGPVACFEVYQGTASTDARASFLSVWADDADYRPGQLGVDDLNRALAYERLIMLPTCVYYAPGSNLSVTIPASEASVDATNLAVTFPVPPSGKVKVTLTAYLITGADQILWSVRSGSTTYNTQTVLNGALNGMVTYESVLTGLTPLSAYSLAWRHWGVAGGGLLKLDAASGYAATMTVTPLAA